MNYHTSVEAIHELNELQNILNEGKELLKFKANADAASVSMLRAQILQSVLKKNERGCSQEELNTVSEIVTGQPIILMDEQADKLLMEGQKVLWSVIDSGVNTALSYCDHIKNYLEKLDSHYKEIKEESKITNFVNSFPHMTFDELTNLPTSFEVASGTRRVDTCLAEYSAGLISFTTKMSEFFDSIKTFKQTLDGKDDLQERLHIQEQMRSFFSTSIEKLHNASVALLQHRMWVLNELSK